MLGAFSSIARDVPFWNWYGFPVTFTVAQIVDSIIGMAIVGLGLALIARKDLNAAGEGD